MELFPTGSIENRGLLNIFNNTNATAEQSHDMLHFQEIGSSDLDDYIIHNILKKPSTAAPIRKKKQVLTMTPANKISQKHE